MVYQQNRLVYIFYLHNTYIKKECEKKMCSEKKLKEIRENMDKVSSEVSNEIQASGAKVIELREEAEQKLRSMLF